LAPFHETLPPEHQQLANSINYEEEMLRLYLTDYFQAEGAKAGTPDALQVAVGSRFQIKEVDWRVLGCYPPSGIITPKTSVRCMRKPLSSIAVIQKMHVLPVAATLPLQKGEDGNMRPRQLDPNEIFREYLRPWVTSEGGPAAAAAGAAPAAASSRGRSASASSSSSASASASASAASSSAAAAAAADAEQKHVVEGDLFVSRGVQFKVVSCVPDNGVIDASTEIFTAGPALPDIERIQIMPIYESLPNRDKQATGAQIFQRYLLPYFQGRFRHVKAKERITIDGVEFVVMSVTPSHEAAFLDCFLHLHCDCGLTASVLLLGTVTLSGLPNLRLAS